MPNDQWTYQTASAYVASRVSEWSEFSAGRGEKPSWLHEMADRLLCFWCWLKLGNCYIRDRAEKIVPLYPNHAQIIVFAAMLKQACEGKPIRVCVPKSRKHGVSTFVQCLYAFLCAYYANQKAVTIAHESDATDEIFAIAKRAAQYCGMPSTIKVRDIDFDQASTYSCQTAGGTAVGAGGTPNILHISELAKWEKNKDETEYNSTISVPDTSTSIIVKESTLKGRELFWKRCEESINPCASYAFVFLPWFIDPACEDSGDWIFEPTDSERGDIATARTYGIELSLGQLAWRRRKVSELGLAVVRQEYPSTPEEALSAYTGLILPDLRPWVVDTLPFDPPAVAIYVGGIDFGYHDPTVAWTAVIWDSTLYLVDFYRRTGGLAADHAPNLWNGGTYYCDPASVSDRNELASECRERRKMSVQFVGAPRKKRVGEDVSVTELKRVIKIITDGRLRIYAPVAAQLLIESTSFFWNEKTGKPDETRTDDSAHFDSIMALKYLVMGVYHRLVPAPPPDAPRTDRRPQPTRRAMFRQGRI